MLVLLCSSGINRRAPRFSAHARMPSVLQAAISGAAAGFLQGLTLFGEFAEQSRGGAVKSGRRMNDARCLPPPRRPPRCRTVDAAPPVPRNLHKQRARGTGGCAAGRPAPGAPGRPTLRLRQPRARHALPTGPRRPRPVEENFETRSSCVAATVSSNSARRAPARGRMQRVPGPLHDLDAPRVGVRRSDAR